MKESPTPSAIRMMNPGAVTHGSGCATPAVLATFEESTAGAAQPLPFHSDLEDPLPPILGLILAAMDIPGGAVFVHGGQAAQDRA